MYQKKSSPGLLFYWQLHGIAWGFQEPGCPQSRLLHRKRQPGSGGESMQRPHGHRTALSACARWAQLHPNQPRGSGGVRVWTGRAAAQGARPERDVKPLSTTGKSLLPSKGSHCGFPCHPIWCHPVPPRLVAWSISAKPWRGVGNARLFEEEKDSSAFLTPQPHCATPCTPLQYTEKR